MRQTRLKFLPSSLRPAAYLQDFALLRDILDEEVVVVVLHLHSLARLPDVQPCVALDFRQRRTLPVGDPLCPHERVLLCELGDGEGGGVAERPRRSLDSMCLLDHLQFVKV